jgi:AcrR family transcriptional regulator
MGMRQSRRDRQQNAWMATPPDTPSERALARQEEILAVATELFATRGYRGSGILELAKRVGMSHAGILHHFGTKENLLLAVIARRDRMRGERMITYRSEGLEGFLAAYVSYNNTFNEPEIMTRLAVVLRAENLMPEDPLHEYFDQRAKRERKFMTMAIREGQKNGRYRKDIDPVAKAAEIEAFTIGLHTIWLLNKDAIDVRRVASVYVREVINELTGADPARPAP